MNLTIQQLIEKCNATEYSAKHSDNWRNEVAADLNEILHHIKYQLERYQGPFELANATFRIIDRVAEFEGIEKTKPRRKKK